MDTEVAQALAALDRRIEAETTKLQALIVALTQRLDALTQERKS